MLEFLWCVQWPHGHVNNMRVCWWEHLGACVETVCHISLVHVDHFAWCLYVALLVFRQILNTVFINWPPHGRLPSSAIGQLCCLRPFATELVRFRAVVADLIARAPEVFCRKLCVYLECVTGAEEMAGIMAFIYVHTHLHCPVSGTLTNWGDTFLLGDVIGASAHKNCVRQPWGQSQGLFKLNEQVFWDLSAVVQGPHKVNDLASKFTSRVELTSRDLCAIVLKSLGCHLYLF